MNSLDLFLIQYSLAAIFLLLLIKTIGIPIPIPADLIILTAAARVAQGKLNVWQAFFAIFVALVAGGVIQFLLARGPGRGLLYRFGRYIGLTTPLRTFIPGLVVGSFLFLGLHFFLGYLGGSLLSTIGHVLPLSWVVVLVLLLLLTIFAVWILFRRRKKKTQPDVEGTSLELWHEGICPACLALYTVNQMRSPVNVETTNGESILSTQHRKGTLTHGNNF